MLLEIVAQHDIESAAGQSYQLSLINAQFDSLQCEKIRTTGPEVISSICQELYHHQGVVLVHVGWLPVDHKCDQLLLFGIIGVPRKLDLLRHLNEARRCVIGECRPPGQDALKDVQNLASGPD
jgi:hypothetical protein